MENIKSKYNNNNFKASAPTWNDTFGLSDGSYSIADIQDHFEFIITKHETLTVNPPSQIYPNKVKNRIGYNIRIFNSWNNDIVRKYRKDVGKDKN